MKRDGEFPTVLTSLLAALALAGCTAPAYVEPVEPRSVVISPAPPAEALPPEGPVSLTLDEAVVRALQNNRSFRVERLAPGIQRTFEQEELARFDPLLRARAQAARERTEQEAEFPLSGIEDVTITEAAVAAALSQFFPLGTQLNLTAQWQRSLAHGDFSRQGSHTIQAGLTVTQSLLRGYGSDVNLASLRQARLDTQASKYEVRAAAESLVASVESKSWDFVLARRRLEIFTESLQLAQQQLRETEERISVGKLPQSERAAALSEVALRKEELINARSEMLRTRLELLRLINPEVPELWGRELHLLDEPTAPEVELDERDQRVKLALRMRPDLNEARIQVKRGDLEVVKTKNGLLPKLDFFVQLGKSGEGETFSGSLGDVENDRYNARGVLDFEFPVGNRAPRARHRRAVRRRGEALAALRNFEHAIQVQVRSALIEVERARQQVAATAATRRYREESLRAEEEKLGLGKSTSFLVAQAQRDLVESRIAEVEARVNLLKALVELYRVEGSLLERRGVKAPGTEPVSLRPAFPDRPVPVSQNEGEPQTDADRR